MSIHLEHGKRYILGQELRAGDLIVTSTRTEDHAKVVRVDEWKDARRLVLMCDVQTGETFHWRQAKDRDSRGRAQDDFQGNWVVRRDVLARLEREPRKKAA